MPQSRRARKKTAKKKNDRPPPGCAMNLFLMSFTEIRFNPKPDRHSDSDSAASASGSRDASFTHNRLLSARNDVNNSSSSSSSSSASEDNQERSSNTEAYLPPPPVDSRTIVYKTQKRFFSAVDVVDLLKSTESYQVF